MYSDGILLVVSVWTEAQADSHNVFSHLLSHFGQSNLLAQSMSKKYCQSFENVNNNWLIVFSKIKMSIKCWPTAIFGKLRRQWIYYSMHQSTEGSYHSLLFCFLFVYLCTDMFQFLLFFTFRLCAHAWVVQSILLHYILTRSSNEFCVIFSYLDFLTGHFTLYHTDNAKKRQNCTFILFQCSCKFIVAHIQGNENCRNSVTHISWLNTSETLGFMETFWKTEPLTWILNLEMKIKRKP